MSHPILDAAKRGHACELAALGLTRRQVASRLGCSLRTLRRERLRNPEFSRRYDEAEAATLARPLEALKRHARTSWRAAAWLLERTDPQSFASRRPGVWSPDQLKRACRQLVEAALEEVDFERRTPLYGRLTQIIDECGAALGSPAPANRTALERPTPLADEEQWRLAARRELEAADGLHAVTGGPRADTWGQPADSQRTARTEPQAPRWPKIPGFPHNPL